jgi:methylglutaconyl-CoA hydratase
MTTNLTEAYVKATTEAGITTIEFFHPQSNSLPGHILRLLADTIRTAGQSAATSVIVLKSAGEKAFCAGASFDELMAIESEAAGLTFFSGFALVINAMRTCPKLIIGRIQGKCVGGGVGLAAAVDYAIAVEASAVKLSELAVGIGPFVVGPAVERKIGTAAFTALAIDASSWRTSAWAREMGLFAELVPNAEALDLAVNRLAATLSKSNPEAMASIKKISWEGTDHWDTLLIERAGISGRLVLSEFTRNAINTFKGK